MNEWTVIDVETTGLDPVRDRVVEFASVFRENGKLNTFSSFVNEGVHIPPEVSGITHIVDNDLQGFGNLNQILKDWGKNPKIIVAHKAAFDSGFLPFKDKTWICTMRAAMHLYPDAPNYKNMTLRYYLNLKVDVPENLAPHRALYDAIVTTAIFEYMLKEHSIEKLIDLKDRPVVQKTCHFGKHRGTFWKEVPRDYLQWILRSDIEDTDVKHTARHFLAA